VKLWVAKMLVVQRPAAQHSSCWCSVIGRIGSDRIYQSVIRRDEEYAKRNKEIVSVTSYTVSYYFL
jgi:hypothetical protein